MSTLTDKSFARIWLEPREGADPYIGQQWCQDNQWGEDGIEYVRADLATNMPTAHVDGEVADWIGTTACPCTTFEQDETCPVGSPSLLCGACGGKGIVRSETVIALAAEMLKVAEQVDELEDPFAAWESIELLKSENERLTKINGEHCDAVNTYIGRVSTLQDEIAALNHNPAPQTNVRVRPLDWEKVALDSNQWNWLEIARAHTPFGKYSVEKHTKGFLRVMFGAQRIGHFEPGQQAEAEASAQADLETRIREALATEGK